MEQAGGKRPMNHVIQTQETLIFFCFLSWVANMQLNHWTKRLVRMQLTT